MSLEVADKDRAYILFNPFFQQFQKTVPNLILNCNWLVHNSLKRLVIDWIFSSRNFLVNYCIKMTCFKKKGSNDGTG